MITDTGYRKSISRSSEDEFDAISCSAHASKARKRNRSQGCRLLQSFIYGPKAGRQVEISIRSGCTESIDCCTTFPYGNLVKFHSVMSKELFGLATTPLDFPTLVGCQSGLLFRQLSLSQYLDNWLNRTVFSFKQLLIS